MMATATLAPAVAGNSLFNIVLEKKKRPRSKKVSWASADRLCQVRLFAAEDAPSLSGLAYQEQLQIKSTKFLHETGDLPPGFGGLGSPTIGVDPNVVASFAVSQTWRSPDLCTLDPSWRVVAGEESEEVEIQKQRELRVLEAVYPRPSAIPQSPFEPQDQEEYDDSNVLKIPVVSMEEEEVSDSPKGLQEALQNVSPPGMHLQNNNQPPKHDMVAAAAAAVAALSSVKENNSLIDPHLLMQILSNPSLVESLSAAQSSGSSHPPQPSAQPMLASGNLGNGFICNGIASAAACTDAVAMTIESIPKPPVASRGYDGFPPGFTYLQTPSEAPAAMATSLNHRQPPNSQFPNFHHLDWPVTACQSVPSFVATNQQKQCWQNDQYYKDYLQCGVLGFSGPNGPPGFETSYSEKKEQHNDKPRKICAYFNTPKGCRNGSRCMFSHEGNKETNKIAWPWMDVTQQQIKRFKGDALIG